MPRGIPLRLDFNGADLRALARLTDDAKQGRRLLALSLIYDGGTRSEAARHANASVQAVRDWVLRFNADGPDGLIDGKSTARVVEDGPAPYLDDVVRWRLCDLVAWLHGEFGVSLDETTVGRALRAMGYRKLTARPRHHAGDPEVQVTFKKTSQLLSRKSGPHCRPEHP